MVTSEMKDTEDIMDKKAVQEAIQGYTPDELHEMMSEAQRKGCAESYLKECKEGVYEMVGEHRKTISEAYCREATPEETYGMLSPDQRKHVAEAFCKESKKKMVDDNDEDDKKETVSEVAVREMKAQLSEMSTAIKRYQRDEYDRTLKDVVEGYFADWHVTTPSGQEKLDAVKQNLKVLAVAEMAGSTKVDDIAPATARAWETVKPLAEMTRAALAGPSVVIGTVSVSGSGPKKFGYDPQTGRYDPDFVQQSLRTTGALGGRSGGVR